MLIKSNHTHVLKARCKKLNCFGEFNLILIFNGESRCCNGTFTNVLFTPQLTKNI